MGKKKVNIIEFLILGIVASFVAKIIEWIFQFGSGAMTVEILRSVAMYQILFLIGVSVIVVALLKYKKIYYVPLVPILYYFIKEFYNWVLTPLIEGTPIVIGVPHAIALFIEPLCFGISSGIIVKFIYDKA